MYSKTIYIVLFACLITAGMEGCSGGRKEKNERDETRPEMALADSSSTDMIMLSKRDEQYANIVVDTVRVKKMAESTTLTGTTRFDESQITVITSRVRGRLDKVFAQNPQEMIQKGQPLYAIYSEELLSYENELLNALQQQSSFGNKMPAAEQLVESARRRLLLWGLTPDQIKELETKREASPLISFYSPVSGTVVEIGVSEGQYVETGTPLYRVANLSQLWIEAQMYPVELRWLNENPTISVEFDAYPGELYLAKPVFDNPSLEAGQKISLVRFLVTNRDSRLKPGMMAYVQIKRNERKTMVIPKSSILVGDMTTAWIKTGEGMYEARMVELGIQNKAEVEVLSGLKPGELIVTHGAYLLNSAWVLKKGAGMPGMEGMKM